MSNRVRVSVNMGEDGKAPQYALMVDQIKVADLSWVEVLELSLQATSTLRYLPRK